MRRRTTRILVFAFFLILLQSLTANDTVRAVIAAPVAIGQPLPTELRKPFGQFLREFGFSDVEVMMNSARTGHIGGIYFPNVRIFRLEDASTCDEEMSLTIVGEVTRDTFRSHLMVMAGKWFQRGDAFIQVFKLKQSLPPPVWLMRTADGTDKRAVTLVETPKGWIWYVSPK